MKNKLLKLTDKHIGIAGIFFSLMGLGAVLCDNLFTGMQYIPLLKLVRFSNMQHLTLLFFDIRTNTNIVELLFFVALLVSSILYIKTKGVEVRLLRFCLFVALLLNAYSFVLSIVWYALSTFTVSTAESFSFIQLILSYTVNISYVAITYIMLWRVNTDQKIKMLSEKDSGFTFVPASLWLRFVHLLTDIIVCFLLAFPLTSILIYLGVRDIGISEERIFILTFIIFRFLYYIVCEAVWAATPGKMLTGTRVVSKYKEEGVGMLQTIIYKDDKPSMMTILKRSLIRFVPFEPIFFLVGARLHDMWTNTDVVVEERKGVKGRVYLLTFVGIIILIVSSWWAYNDYQEDVARKKEYARSEERFCMSQKVLMSKIDRLSANAYIKFAYSEYYKVVRVEEDSVFCCCFLTDKYISSVLELDDMYMDAVYNMTEQEFPVITLSKQVLKESVSMEYSVYDNSPIIIDDKRYELENIYFVNEPRVNWWSIPSYSVFDDYIEMEYTIKNEGWEFHEIKTEIISGEVENVELVNKKSLYNWQNSVTVRYTMQTDKAGGAEIIFINTNEFGLKNKFCFKDNGDDYVSFVEVVE